MNAPEHVETPPRATPAPPRSAFRVIPLDRVQAWLMGATEWLHRLVAHRALPPTLVIAGLLGLLVLLFVSVRMSAVAAAAPAAPSEVVRTTGPDIGRLVERFAPAQASGFSTMLAGMDSLRRAHDVVDVPSMWLEGAYLADASRFPDVQAFWLRYRDYLSAVQARDTALFRAGLVTQLETEGIEGALLSMRVGQAMREFEQSQPDRGRVYRNMEELATASLMLHDLLVERADDIVYDPAVQQGVSREPVVEAFVQDTVLRDRMWVLMERIFASLESVGGDLGGSRDNLTEMLLQGVEASSR